MSNLQHTAVMKSHVLWNRTKIAVVNISDLRHHPTTSPYSFCLESLWSDSVTGKVTGRVTGRVREKEKKEVKGGAELKIQVMEEAEGISLPVQSPSPA